jgi:uncharacterized protein YndB with AHSA1/START domain
VPSTETANAVALEVRVDASPETVFDFFIEPDKMIQWMGRDAELDPRSGGIFRVDLNGRHIARGEYVELDRPRRVAFTWGWESEDAPVRPGSSTVEVTLTPDGDGTVVRLVHRDLPGEESQAAHRHGWEHYMARLSVAAGGGDPGVDPWSTPEGAEQGQN